MIEEKMTPLLVVAEGITEGSFEVIANQLESSCGVRKKGAGANSRSADDMLSSI